MLLYQILEKREPVQGDFGIEIETEGKNLPSVNTQGWRSEKDGSLRGESYEYVLDKPLPRDEIRKALDYLAKRTAKAELDFSFRTSVHVHMNVTDCEHEHILNIIYTYLLIEEPLLNYCGRTRKGNRFCLRLQDADGLVDTIRFLFQSNLKGFFNIRHDSIRYASINLEAITKYGSLEFRAMRGTMDVDVIDTWVEALSRIKAFAKQYKTPLEIATLYRTNSSREFCTLVLGDLFKEFDYLRIERDMARSFSLSLDLPYSYKPAKEAKLVPREVLRNLEVNFDLRPEVEAPRIRMAEPADMPAVEVLRGNEEEQGWFLDIDGNEVFKGDYVEICDEDHEYPLSWTDEMTNLAEQLAVFEVERVGFRRMGAGKVSEISLVDCDFVFPSRVLRRVDME